MVCQWGYLHGQCRCPDNRQIISVACDDPSHEPRNAYQGKHRKEER